MSVILQIDTASTHAAVSLSQQGRLLQHISSANQQEHAAFLQPAVASILKAEGLQLEQIDAVSVVIGPGSYTGLRVGLASAKGICYALKKPLIALSTLHVMAAAAQQELIKQEQPVPLLCPMMDARRMEVFTAVYDDALEPVVPANAMLLNHDSFVDILLQNKVLFFGDGAAKFEGLTNHVNALFATDYNCLAAMSSLSYEHYQQQQFSDLIYTEPLYLKEFYNGNYPYMV
jgi:tRNA threonylcarbamoyladenosine biosynthesis protein TsaB